jgi:hypothetical protein
MTYIVGWKTGGNVYVCADSAVTTEYPNYDAPTLGKQRTTFGELAVEDTDRTVVEGALKITYIDKAIVASAGLAHVCKEVVDHARFELIGVSDVRIAITRALQYVQRSTGLCCQIRLIIAAPSEPEPLLCSYDGNPNLEVREIVGERGVHFGQLPGVYKDITAEIVSLLPFLPQSPDDKLASMLAVLQSYGINASLMESGVGGVFAGAYATKDAICWQKDTLYWIYSADEHGSQMSCSLVSVNARDNAIGSSSQEHGIVSLKLGWSSGLTHHQWFARWSDELNDLTKEGRYDYHCFLRRGRPKVVLVEMQKNIESAHLIIENVENSPTSIRTSDGLRDALKGVRSAESTEEPTLFSFFCYSPGPISDSPIAVVRWNGEKFTRVFAEPCYVLLGEADRAVTVSLGENAGVCLFTTKSHLKTYIWKCEKAKGTSDVDIDWKINAIPFRNVEELTNWLKYNVDSMEEQGVRYLAHNPGSSPVYHLSTIRSTIESFTVT